MENTGNYFNAVRNVLRGTLTDPCQLVPPTFQMLPTPVLSTDQPQELSLSTTLSQNLYTPNLFPALSQRCNPETIKYQLSVQ